MSASRIDEQEQAKAREREWILNSPLPQLGEDQGRGAGGSLFSAMHGSLVTSSLIRETTENESANEGYRFGQENRRAF